MAKKIRRRRLSGGALDAPASGAPEAPSSTEAPGGFMKELRDIKKTVGGEGGEGSGQASVRKAIDNPYGTTAFFFCLFLFVIPFTIYSFMGKSDEIFANEVMMSLMSMSMASSGLSWFLLQGDTKNYFVDGFIGIAAASFIGWVYFSWKIWDRSRRHKKKKDED